MKRMLMLWRVARHDLQLLWFALSHPSRPGWLIPAAGLLLLYAVEPLNVAIPPVGLVDDLVLVPLVLHTLLKRLPVEIHASFGRRAL